MQIGNNRPNGPRPNDPKASPLDPDLTKANREGIEDTTRVTSAKTQKSIEERSPAKASENRKAADTFQRSKPEEDPGYDVGQRIKNARAQAGDKRGRNARAQAADRMDGTPDKAQRIANARAQRAEANAQKAAEGRKTAANNSEAVKPDHAKRINAARNQHADRADRLERVENARTQSAEAAKSQRIENARAQYMENSKVEAGNPRDSVRTARIAEGSVELPGRSGELPGVSGKPESTSARSARIEGLRQAHQAGELNTPERARSAASRLLGGE